MPYFLLCRMIEESNFMNPYNKEDKKKEQNELSMTDLAGLSGVEIIK